MEIKQSITYAIVCDVGDLGSAWYCGHNRSIALSDSFPGVLFKSEDVAAYIIRQLWQIDDATDRTFHFRIVPIEIALPKPQTGDHANTAP